MGFINSKAGVSVYQANGTALPTGTYDTLSHVVIAAPSNSQTANVMVANPGREPKNDGSKVVQTNSVCAAILSAGIGSGTIVAANSGGYLSFRASGHGLAVGDVVWLTDTSGVLRGPGKILAKGTDNFTIAKPSTFVANVGTVTYYQRNTSYNFANMQAGRHIMVGGGANSEYLAGVAGELTALRQGCLTQNNPHLATPFYDIMQRTQLRAGGWNVSTGKWRTLVQKSTTKCVYTCAGAGAVTTTDDAASIYTNAGELVYSLGNTPIQGDYAGRGQV